MGIEVPTLCYWEGIQPMNSCMLCVMRDTRTGNLLPSCSTIVQDGMDFETDSGDVCNARKEVLELIIGYTWATAKRRAVIHVPRP